MRGVSYFRKTERPVNLQLVKFSRVGGPILALFSLCQTECLADSEICGSETFLFRRLS